MYKKITFILFIFYSISNFFFSQIEVDFDTTKLSKAFSPDYLQTTIYRNGDSLKVLSEKDGFEMWQKAAKENKPCVLITENREYLYNFAAIERGDLAPIGYKIPFALEFQNFIFDYNNKKIEIKRTPYIDDGGIYKNDFSFQKFWCNDKIPDSYEKGYLKANEYGYSTSYNLTKNQKDKEKLSKRYGFPIILKYNVNEYIYKLSYSYKSLLPKQYNSLLNEIIVTIQKAELSPTGSHVLSKLIGFDSTGVNSSSFYNAREKSSVSFSLAIDKLINNWTIYPQFFEKPIQAWDYIKIEYIKTILEESYSENHKFFEERGNSLNSMVSGIDKYNLKFNKYDIELNINKDSTYQRFWKENVVYDIKAKSYLNSMRCLWGGGFNGSTKGYAFENRIKNKFGRSLIRIITPTAGVLAISSFISKKYYYDNYISSINRNSIDKSAYKIANSFQKVFLTSLAVYGSIAIVDCTWSIKETRRNKKNLNSIRSSLKSQFPKGLSVITVL